MHPLTQTELALTCFRHRRIDFFLWIKKVDKICYVVQWHSNLIECRCRKVLHSHVLHQSGGIWKKSICSNANFTWLIKYQIFDFNYVSFLIVYRRVQFIVPPTSPYFNSLQTPFHCRQCQRRWKNSGECEWKAKRVFLDYRRNQAEMQRRKV